MLGKMKPPRRAIVAECLGKTRWGSERSAQEAVTRLRRENPGAFTSTVRPYRCSTCKRWHVGRGK